MEYIAAIEAFALLSFVSYYFVLEKQGRAAWVRHERRAASDASYRSNQSELRRARDRAPLQVRLVALSGYIFAHALVLGALSVCFGLLVYGVGIVGTPGLWVAWYQLIVAKALLKRSPEAPRKARRLAWVAGSLNGMILVVVAAWLAWEICSTSRNPFYDLSEIPAVSLFLLYPLASLAQALYLPIVARDLERDFDRDRVWRPNPLLVTL